MTKEKDIKRVVPALRFPEFRDAEGWRVLYGCKVFDQISNKNHNSDLPILAISQEHGAIPRDMIDYNVIVTDKSLQNYKVVDRGDFIISLRSFQGGIEYSSYQGICSPAYIILRKKIDIHNLFFKHYFKSHMFIQDLNKNLEGIRDGKMVSYKQFSEILLPVPIPSEQKKIANCLGSLDDLINAVTEKVEALKEYKKGLMQQLFPAEGKTTPALRFPEFQNAEEWEVKPLSKICENLDNRRVPITSGQRKAGDVPYYGASGVIDYVDGHIFDEDLLCISEDGANLVVRTYPIAFSITGKTWVNNHAHVLKFDDMSTQIVVENYINSINVENYITGMAQPKLNRNKLDIIPIPLPAKMNEKEQIANFLLSLNDLVFTEVDRLDQLKAHKKGLMQQLFPTLNV